jgi:hypothetical protein|nr:MAG TPA: hypothetical protein [Caudoviricetes sp.]
MRSNTGSSTAAKKHTEWVYMTPDGLPTGTDRLFACTLFKTRAEAEEITKDIENASIHHVEFMVRGLDD